MSENISGINLDWVSENDLHYNDEWWIAFNKDYTSYYHIPCQEKWRILGIEMVKDEFRQPICLYCKAEMGESVAMLITLQRMEAKLPGGEE